MNGTVQLENTDSSANLEWHDVSVSIILSEVELSVYLCSKLSYECDDQYKLRLLVLD